METKPTITFDNQYVLSRIEENKISKNLKIIQELKQIAPLLSDVELLQLYNKSISIHQSKIQGNGDFLENDILVGVLDKNNISYKKQVTINKSGIIVGFSPSPPFFSAEYAAIALLSDHAVALWRRRYQPPGRCLLGWVQ